MPDTLEYGFFDTGLDAHNTYTTNTYTTNTNRYFVPAIDYMNITPDRITISTELDRKLEEFASKIYKIIEEHTNIDISEEEFMELIKE